MCAGHYHSLFTCGSSPPFQPSFRRLSVTTRPAKVHNRSPCRSSPCPGSDDGYPRHWAFSPSFTPRRYQQRMWGWRPVYTLTGIPLGNHSREATSGRKIAMEQFWFLTKTASGSDALAVRSVSPVSSRRPDNAGAACLLTRPMLRSLPQRPLFRFRRPSHDDTPFGYSLALDEHRTEATTHHYCLPILPKKSFTAAADPSSTTWPLSSPT